MEILIIVLVLFFALVMFGRWKGAPDLLPYERRKAANLKRMSETKHLYVDELQRELLRRLGDEQSASIGADEIRSVGEIVVESKCDVSPRDETTRLSPATS